MYLKKYSSYHNNNNNKAPEGVATTRYKKYSPHIIPTPNQKLYE